MVLTIFIPVLFVCMNDRCQFMQGTHYTNESECRAMVEAQKDNIRRMALKSGGMVTQLESTCVTAKNGLL